MNDILSQILDQNIEVSIHKVKSELGNEAVAIYMSRDSDRSVILITKGMIDSVSKDDQIQLLVNHMAEVTKAFNNKFNTRGEKIGTSI